MSNNINVINLVGRVGGNPEVQTFESDAKVAKVSLAVKRRVKDSEPDWFTVELWGKLAEITEKYVAKGSLIGISGEIKLNEWNDKNGNYRYKLVVRANNLELLSPKSETNKSSQPVNSIPVTPENMTVTVDW